MNKTFAVNKPQTKREGFAMKSMHKTVGLIAVAAGLMLSLSSARAALVINWGTGAHNITTSDTDILNNGIAAPLAYNLPSGNTTINGVAFTGASFTTAGFSTLWESQANIATPLGLTSEYQTLLHGWINEQNVNNFADSHYLTLNDLTPGNTYEFQWWANDSRTGYQYTSTASDAAIGGNSVTLVDNVTDTDGGRGQYAIGTFIADLTGSATIYFGPGGGEVNAYELVDMGVIVPEPSTVLLLGMGGFVLFRLRHGFGGQGLRRRNR